MELKEIEERSSAKVVIDSEQLLACPFCNNKAFLLEGLISFSVFCKNEACFARGPVVPAGGSFTKARKRAIELWNERVSGC